MTEVSIIGSGSWGTALAWLLGNNGHRVTLWSRKQETTDSLAKYHQNIDKLPGVILQDDVVFTSDLELALKDKDMIVLAVPSSGVRSTSARMAPFIGGGQLIVSVAKGIEDGSLMTMTEIIEEEIPNADVAVLSGPSHAEEVGRGLPTTIVAGAHSRESAEKVRTFFMSPAFRVYTSSDMKGIQIGGALKNVIALAAGTADGLGYGDNTKAALITRGSAEMARLGRAMGIRMRTIYGLSGIGDLIVTCASVHSRNRRAGFLMGQGKTPKEAMEAVRQVVEGVHCAQAAHRLAEHYGVEMPIVDEVCKVLFEEKNPRQAVTDLMNRSGKDEVGDF